MDDVDRLVSEARDFNFLGVCVPPFWVKRASREINGDPILLVTVVGFPLGYNMTETKLLEIDQAIENGADEVDVVMNISAFKSNDPWVKIELAKCAKRLHDHAKLLKVIIETSLLNDLEIKRACSICADAGVDFVKTSTGFSSHGAIHEQVSLMRSVLPKHVGIKASGGIKTFDQAQAFVRAGAERIGTSSGINIVQFEKNQTSKF
jgi:deoxyribose-phosphate aldolase